MSDYPPMLEVVSYLIVSRATVLCHYTPQRVHRTDARKWDGRSVKPDQRFTQEEEIW